jgi:hypothetical protein
MKHSVARTALAGVSDGLVSICSASLFCVPAVARDLSTIKGRN